MRQHRRISNICLRRTYTNITNLLLLQKMSSLIWSTSQILVRNKPLKSITYVLMHQVRKTHKNRLRKGVFNWNTLMEAIRKDICYFLFFLRQCFTSLCNFQQGRCAETFHVLVNSLRHNFPIKLKSGRSNTYHMYHKL